MSEIADSTGTSDRSTGAQSSRTVDAAVELEDEQLILAAARSLRHAMAQLRQAQEIEMSWERRGEKVVRLPSLTAPSANRHDAPHRARDEARGAVSRAVSFASPHSPSNAGLGLVRYEHIR